MPKKLLKLVTVQLAFAIVFNPLAVFAIPKAPVNLPLMAPPLSVNLSTYVRVGRHDLPEPTRTAAPPNSLLAQEVSAVTYNWDTDSLFVVGDGGTSVVQITKTGQLINSMTLAPGTSPQGTDFFDPEGLSYVGGGRFVMSEERDRQIVLFTYIGGGTLTRAAAQTVKLGTFVQNIGLEGLSWDPMTNGYIVVKETLPQGIFQTGIDFAAGTATNGSPSTENSTNLFNPALAGLADFADVFALSNLPSLNGQPDFDNLLVLSQESGKIVNIDRAGNISSSLTIMSDPGNPLSVPAQQHEGLTMDRDGNLYIVSENGGGDFDHPQLWVYSPSTVPNQAPTAVSLNNAVTSIIENSNTASAIKVADIIITDDGLGPNNLTVSGVDAGSFEINGFGLFIKAGTVLDFETKNSYSINVNVDDPTLGGSPDAFVGYTLTVLDQDPEVPPVPTLIISEVSPWSSSNSPFGADWFEVTNTGNTPVNITGWKMDDNSNTFAQSVALNGITSIAAGESVIFLESSASNPAATAIAAFKSAWFGANVPPALQVGSYQGGGVGLSTGGDAVNLYNGTGELQANVIFSVSPGGPSFPTFDNWAGLNNETISELSVAGVHDAFVAVNDPAEIGSPGSAGKIIISEVAPWSSGNSPVGADWIEVTNTRSTPVNITGWRMDDNSQSFAAAVNLNGITTIASGESVIFLETTAANPPAIVVPTFKALWFGEAPVTVQVGTYQGGGVGLGTGGDAVNVYNSTGQLQASVTFSVSPGGPLFPTFDNTAGLNNTTISQLSVVGINGAFAALNDTNEIGSPGGPPSVSANGPYSVNEGSSVTLNATGSDPNFDSLTYEWDLDNNGSFETTGQSVAFAGVDGPAVHTVRVRATDGRNLSAVSSTTVTVANVAPTVNASFSAARVGCGVGNATLSVNFTDPGAVDTHTATINWGDGNSQNVNPATSPLSLTHTYAKAGSYTATVTVSDDDGASDVETAIVSVDFNTTGFLPPIKDEKSYKRNSTIPVKIAFSDCNGSFPANLAPAIEVSGLEANTPLVTGVMRFTSGQYHFNLNTKSLPDRAGTYLIKVTVPLNGQTVTVPITVRP